MISQMRWIRATRSKPCPICRGPDNCEFTDRFCYCGRISDGSKKQNAGGQFLHILDTSPDSIDWLRNNPKPDPAQQPKAPVRTAIRDWDKFARDAFNHPNAGSARRELALKLGASVISLERLGIGWINRVRGWSVPERDSTRKAIGNNRRLMTGEKRRERGSASGLTYDPVGWLEWEVNPNVYLPEGMSDTAIMLSMGFSAVGRPSNLGGVELLGELLKQVPADRRIVIVGENDHKPHGTLPPARQKQHKADCNFCSVCWPGKFGAIRTAERLAVILNREIEWILPPAGFKDIRAWSNKEDEFVGKAAYAS